MSALLERSQPPYEAAAMRVPDLTEVIAVERQAYPVPWTHGNFVDSLAAGYPAEVLRGSRAELLGYWVAMPGVDELHLLNITVTPAWQGRGLAVAMLDRLVDECRRRVLCQPSIKSKSAARAVAGSGSAVRASSSHSSVAKKLSHSALS